MQFRDTGDEMIDKWEEQIAQGLEPDLMSAFTPEELERLSRMRAQAKSNVPRTMKDTFEMVQRKGLQEGVSIQPSKFPSTFGDE